MAVYPTPAVGQRLTADFVASMLPDYTIKATDSDRISTVTPTSDSELFTGTLSANSIYEIEMRIYFSGLLSASGGVRTQWSVPSGATGVKWGFGPFGTVAGTTGVTDTVMNQATTFAGNISYSNTRNALGVTSMQVFLEGSLISIGATSGPVTLQWAQVNSNAAASRIHLGSHIKWRRIA